MEEPSDLLEDDAVRQGDRCFVKAAGGELMEMHGYSGGPTLDLDPRIDLCQPICEQAQRTWAEEARRAAEQSGWAA